MISNELMNLMSISLFLLKFIIINSIAQSLKICDEIVLDVYSIRTNELMNTLNFAIGLRFDISEISTIVNRWTAFLVFLIERKN